MRKKRLWITSKILCQCQADISFYEKSDDLGIHIEGADEKVDLSKRVIRICKDYIMR